MSATRTWLRPLWERENDEGKAKRVVWWLRFSCPPPGPGCDRSESGKTTKGKLNVLFGGCGFHVRHPDLVATALLRGIQSLVRALHQAGEQRGLFSRGDADADGQLEPAWKGRRRDLGADPLGQRAGSLLGGLVKDDAELLSAVARTDVRLPSPRGEDLGQLVQHGVALEGAVGVVDALEVVEVDHQEGDALVIAPRPVHLLQVALRQGAPVG